MITSSDAGAILYDDCKIFNLPIYRNWSFPKKKVDTDRIVVIAKSLSPDSYWTKGFVEVNFCVPDYKDNANLKRLNELERGALKVLGYKTGEFDKKYSKYLQAAFQIRNNCDYSVFFIVSREDAEEQYQHALEMLKNIRPDKNEE